MDRASEKVPFGALTVGLLLGLGAAAPASSALAASSMDGAGLVAQGLACGPAETLVEASRGAFLSRVSAPGAGRHGRAGVVATPKPAIAKRAVAVKLAAPKMATRLAAQRNASRRDVPKRADARTSAGRLPEIVQEPRANMLRSFFACNAAAPVDFAAGTGWRLVGPLRRS